jgi:phosphoribosylglycinamide formyltransferase-1
VHLVDEGVDTGPIVVQKAVPVKSDDTADSLHRRIQEAEHEAYPEALGILIRGHYRVVGRRVTTSTAVG